jgi:hypothetical protein
MDILNRVLLVLHFLGLAMGLSVSFSGMVMGGLIDKAAPAERAVLGRFPPVMARVGDIGLTLLWASGLGLLFFKWGGTGNLGNMPWQFHAKLTLVVVLTALVGYIRMLQRRAGKGDAAAMARMRAVGGVAFLVALSIVTFAVLSFD